MPISHETNFGHMMQRYQYQYMAEARDELFVIYCALSRTGLSSQHIDSYFTTALAGGNMIPSKDDGGLINQNKQTLALHLFTPNV
jgi:hypothetical protein